MRKAIPLLLAVALVSGCGAVYRQPVFQGTLLEQRNVEQLRTGMTQPQVVALLGTPAIADPFHHERWDYTASQRVGRLGRTEIKNLTLHFEGDSLTTWEGEYFPEQDEHLAKVAPREFGRNLAKDKEKKRKR